MATFEETTRPRLEKSAIRSLSEVVKAHSDFLLANYPTHHGKFQRLVHADLEAAMGEAAVFSMLRTYFRANPEPQDEPGTLVEWILSAVKIPMKRSSLR